MIVTFLAANLDIAVLTAVSTAFADLKSRIELAFSSARMNVIHLACAAPNPSCVLIELLIPGKRVGLKSSRKKSASVTMG